MAITFESVDVIDCARCGGAHHRLTLRLFTRRPARTADGREPFAFAPCPTTDEPILFYVRVVEARVVRAGDDETPVAPV